MITAVLFDLDGVLLNAAEGCIESFSYACKQMGFNQLSYDEMKNVVGPPVNKSFVSLCHCSLEESTIATNIFRDYYKSEALFKAIPYDGVLSTLETLKLKGFKVGVATYKREDYALTLLENFGISQFCDVIHGADFECIRTKTDIVNMCIEELKSNKEKIVLVGDTYHDAEGAQKAGIKFIGATYGFGFKNQNEVNEYPNIGSIERPCQLLELL